MQSEMFESAFHQTTLGGVLRGLTPTYPHHAEVRVLGNGLTCRANKARRACYSFYLGVVSVSGGGFEGKSGE